MIDLTAPAARRAVLCKSAALVSVALLLRNGHEEEGLRWLGSAQTPRALMSP